jgi:hypothetical protein
MASVTPLAESFISPVELAHRKGGQSIQHELHGSTRTIGATVYGPFAAPPPVIGAEMDCQLLYWHGRLGNAWTKIGRQVNLPSYTCKNVIIKLIQREKNRHFMGEPTTVFDIDEKT